MRRFGRQKTGISELFVRETFLGAQRLEMLCGFDI